MPDLEVLKLLSGLGVGALLAGIVLLWKRSDDKAYQATLTEIIKRMDAKDERMLTILEGTTDALRDLKATVAVLVSMDKLEDRLRRLEGAR